MKSSVMLTKKLFLKSNNFIIEAIKIG